MQENTRERVTRGSMKTLFFTNGEAEEKEMEASDSPNMMQGRSDSQPLRPHDMKLAADFVLATDKETQEDVSIQPDAPELNDAMEFTLPPDEDEVLLDEVMDTDESHLLEEEASERRNQWRKGGSSCRNWCIT